MAFFDWSGGLSTGVRNFLQKLSGDERLHNLLAVKEEVQNWQPNPYWGSYYGEMTARVNYLAGAMQGDMAVVMKRQLPKTHKDLEREQLNLGFVRHLILEKAQVFPDSTRFYLVDKKTDEECKATDDGMRGKVAKAFAHMIEKGHWMTGFQNTDAITHLCHRAGLKWWWDDLALAPRISVYPPHKVFILPNPYRYWDPYSAAVVMFEQPGFKGVRGRPRYEVWGTRDPSVAKDKDKHGNPIFHPELLYVTDGYEDHQLNPDDQNPFVDEDTKKPIVPFTWFGDDVIDNIYTIGREDMLTPNRTMNWGLTNLHHNIIWQSLGIPTFEVPAGKKVKLPKTRIISPKHAMELPPEVKFYFVKPDLDVGQPLAFYKTLAKFNAMLEGVDPKAVDEEYMSPESGKAIRARQAKTMKHIEKMRPIYLPYVKHAMRRGIMVHNYYALFNSLDKIDLDLYQPMVAFGDLSVPIDPEEIMDRGERGIDMNVTTNAHIYAEMKGIPLEQAKKAVIEIESWNTERSQAKASAFGLPAGGDGEDDDENKLRGFFGVPDKKKPVAKPDDKGEEEPTPDQKKADEKLKGFVKEKVKKK